MDEKINIKPCFREKSGMFFRLFPKFQNDLAEAKYNLKSILRKEQLRQLKLFASFFSFFSFPKVKNQ